jgi:sugar fermentation stimulation protein A
MTFNQSLQAAILIKRYKRFLADVETEDGQLLTVHCPNSGSMRGCSTPGSEVMISRSANPKRKYPHTLEMVKAKTIWVGVNTARTNYLAAEAFAKGVVAEIGTVDHIQREVKTSARTRLDFLLQKGKRKIYVEVKNCSLVENDVAMFPDAVTVRGTKHLRELLALKQAGFEAAVFFCVQRRDAHSFTAARHIDPEYGDTLSLVHSHGVLVLAYEAEVTPSTIEIVGSLEVAV